MQRKWFDLIFAIAIAIVWLMPLQSLTNWPLERSIIWSLGLVGLWLVIRTKSSRTAAPDDATTMTSIVLLLKGYRPLTNMEIAAVLKRAWGMEIQRGEGATENYVVGDFAPFMINRGGSFYIMHSMDRPYFDNQEEVMEEIYERRQQKAVESHRAWMSLDLLRSDNEIDRESAYRDIAKVLGYFLNAGCVGIMRVSESILVPYEPEHIEAMKSGRIEEVFGETKHVPIIKVSPDDPRMKSAVEEARRRWPEFVAAFANRRPDQEFSVKSEFVEGDASEFMWADVDSIEGDLIHGRLGNEPADLKKIEEGDKVTVHVKDLNDWVYTNGDELVGGFTVKVVMSDPKK